MGFKSRQRAESETAFFPSLQNFLLSSRFIRWYDVKVLKPKTHAEPQYHIHDVLYRLICKQRVWLGQ